MWPFMKRQRKFEKKSANPECNTQNRHIQEYPKEMNLPDPVTRIPTEGYVTINYILSDHMTVLFAVPSHEWNELVESKEWKDFQALLEKTQEAFYQRRLPIVES